MLYLGIGLIVAVLYLDFRLGSVSESNANNLNLVMRHITESNRGIYGELGNIQADLENIRRCPDCEQRRKKLTGAE